MKTLALVLLIAGFAKADTFTKKSVISCTIKVKNSVNTLKIGIANLGTRNAKLINLAKNEEEGPILQGKNNKEIKSMNDQGGAMGISTEGNLELAGDGDGCTYVTVVLYKNAGFTRGWASEKGSEVPHWYTKDVVCKVTSLN